MYFVGIGDIPDQMYTVSVQLENVESDSYPEASSARSYDCSVCSLTNMDKQTYIAHNNDVHQMSAKGFCDVCGKSFFSQSGLWKHKKVHHGEKDGCPKCTICGKLFAYSSSLNVHMRKHSNRRPYLCKKCGKSYKHESELKYHTCYQSSIS